MTLKEGTTALNWSEANTEIEANLESVRLREMKRYAWKMQGATEEQKELVCRARSCAMRFLTRFTAPSEPVP